MTFARNQRALVIVNSLSTNYGGLWKRFYRITEVAAIATAKALLHQPYGSISVVSGTDATKDRFLAALRTAANAPGVEVVDVFLQLHGKPGTFCFFDADVSSAALRDEILSLGLPANRLRLFYNTGCYGDSQNHDDMLAAGFIATIGSVKVNATGTAEFPLFCILWRFGATIQQSMRAADHGLLRIVQDGIARHVLPASEIDSEKRIRGRGSLRISHSA
jgi:hypothetical protein